MEYDKTLYSLLPVLPYSERLVRLHYKTPMEEGVGDCASEREARAWVEYMNQLQSDWEFWYESIEDDEECKE